MSHFYPDIELGFIIYCQIPTILLANKTDLGDQRSVTDDEVYKLSQVSPVVTGGKVGPLILRAQKESILRHKNKAKGKEISTIRGFLGVFIYGIRELA